MFSRSSIVNESISYTRQVDHVLSWIPLSNNKKGASLSELIPLQFQTGRHCKSKSHCFLKKAFRCLLLSMTVNLNSMASETMQPNAVGHEWTLRRAHTRTWMKTLMRLRNDIVSSSCTMLEIHRLCY